MSKLFIFDFDGVICDSLDVCHDVDRIIDTIQDLDRFKHHLAIITSNHTDLIHSFLNKYFKSNRFSYILGADKSASKVDKIHYIREQLNFLPNQVYYVGDTKGDVIEAKTAKVNGVAVTWGYHDRLLLKTAEPDFLIDDPKELIEIQK